MGKKKRTTEKTVKKKTRVPKRMPRKQYEFHYRDKKGVSSIMSIQSSSVAKAKEELRYELDVNRLPSGVTYEIVDFEGEDRSLYQNEREMDERDVYSDWMVRMEDKHGSDILTDNIKDEIYFELQSGGTFKDCVDKARRMGISPYGTVNR